MFPFITEGQNELVPLNDVHHVGRYLSHGGETYTLSNQKPSRIFENYCHDISHAKTAGPVGMRGIHLDGGTSWYTTEHNVLKNIQDKKIHRGYKKQGNGKTVST